METKGINQKLQEKVLQYKTEVGAREPTVAERRLQLYQRLLKNRKAVFETNDTENRLSLLPWVNVFDYPTGYDWKDGFRKRILTRQEFRNLCSEDHITRSDEEKTRMKSLLEEDRKTPYAPKSISEKLKPAIKYFFPWIR